MAIATVKNGKLTGLTCDGDTFLVECCGETMLAKVVRDDFPENPREWDSESMLNHMVCFHSRYNLGDEHDYDEPRDFLMDMVKTYIQQEELIRQLKGQKLNMRLIYDRSRKEYNLMVPVFFNTVIGSTEPEMYCEGSFSKSDIEHGYLTDAVIENLSMSCMYELLDQCNNFSYLPLYLFDHSGITMNTTGFSCPWDSGQVGWIWTDRETVMKNLINYSPDPNMPEDRIPITDANWKEAANMLMANAVKIYDDYLTGEVYGYELYKLNEDGDVNEDSLEAVYGYYGDKYENSGLLSEFTILKNAK